MTNGRAVHLTLTKCGSQWVRDVLAAPELSRYGGLPYSGISLSLGLCGALNLPQSEFSGPIYQMNRWEWRHWSQPGDRAIVVLRDPRDRAISLLYSTLYSHGNSIRITQRRDILAKLLDSPSETLRYQLFSSENAIRFYRTWAGAQEGDARIIRYEDLIVDQLGEFSRLLEWLGWQVPRDILAAVVDRLSFTVRSGRTPGNADMFSHYRRGVAGDWRNYFDRSHGELWEQLYPGLLTELGYETTDDWWRVLPDSKLRPESLPPPDGLEKLRRRNQALEADLIAKEAEIQLLNKACVERLALIERLEAKLKS